MNKLRKQNKIIETALKVFSKQGFYNTTVSQIADDLKMSVGNFYNYFPSKKSLARSAIVFVTKKLANNLRYINSQKITSEQKVKMFVKEYFAFIQQHPEMIEYFFRVYLSSRELFCEHEDCGFALAKEFIDEVHILFEDGVKNGEFVQKDFFVAFSCIAGILGGMTFLSGEHVLEQKIEDYCDSVAKTICHALK